MGGDKETIAIQTKKTEKGTVECGRIRYHESGGEVHFHDDANKLKVAIPSGVWYKLYQDLMQHAPNEVVYADTKNMAIFRISTKLKKAKRERPARIDVDMTIESISVDDRLAALQKFTQG